ncbi:MAG: SDR family NAD(P)-dependent oxidoreductase [Candidatus Eremiobacteraeota bacterium]|nr:SDR family NAD(P)-dependent oxidoreductase [Candidatus Eremiobacteraeota bacterium]
MAKPLQGTVALVTGASSGIGEATALALAEQGADVAIAARRVDRLEALAERIRRAGAEVLVLETDVTKEDEARAMVQKTVARFARLDTLVNNAGLMLLGPISDADVTEWLRMLHLNVEGLMFGTHAALPHLLDAAQQEPRRVADIVNISSVAGRVARSGAGVYNATKFAVGAFSESLRQEVTKRHVRVSLVEPGMVATELGSHNRPEILVQLRAGLPIDEPLQATDIADAIVYVITRPRYVTINEVLIRPTQQER